MLYEIVFSPTGGTQKVADIIAEALAGDVSAIDLSDPKTDFSACAITADDVAVIAVPSFGGRVPAVAVERLTQVKGQGSRAVIVCVYGNRAYEDTLVELEDAAKKAGFKVVAAVAAIAEHSIAHQFATGRPDEKDAAALKDMAAKISQKIASGDDSEPQVPGNRPYKKESGAGMTPKARKECVKCGLCAQKCPVQAIHADDPKKTDSKKCISCMRCVSICPHHAREVSGLMLSMVGKILKKSCEERKECELHI